MPRIDAHSVYSSSGHKSVLVPGSHRLNRWSSAIGSVAKAAKVASDEFRIGPHVHPKTPGLGTGVLHHASQAHANASIVVATSMAASTAS